MEQTIHVVQKASINFSLSFILTRKFSKMKDNHLTLSYPSLRYSFLTCLGGHFVCDT